MAEPTIVACTIYLVRAPTARGEWWIATTPDTDLKTRLARLPDDVVAEMLAAILDEEWS